MAKPAVAKGLSDKTRQFLTSLRDRIGGPTIAMDVWDRLMSERERERLGGNLDTAYRLHRGIVRMWMHIRNVSDARAIADIGYGIGLLDSARHEWLLKELGEKANSTTPIDVPAWDHSTGKLFYRGKPVRSVRSLKRTNVVQVLDWFEQRGWPQSITVPKEWSQPTVNETVRSLNRGLKAIKFHARNGARSIYWE